MSLCDACGMELQPGEKLCGDCGALAGTFKADVVGAVHTDRTQAGVLPEHPVRDARAILVRAGRTAAGMLRTPQETLSQIVRTGDLLQAVVLSTVFALMLSLVALILYVGFLRSFSPLLGMLGLDSLGSVYSFGGYGSRIRPQAGIAVALFFSVLLLTMVSLAGQYTTLWLVGRKAFKGTGSFRQVCAVMSGALAPQILGLPLALICWRISSLLGMGVMLACVMLDAGLKSLALQEVHGLRAERAVWTLALSSLLFTVIGAWLVNVTVGQHVIRMMMHSYF